MLGLNWPRLLLYLAVENYLVIIRSLCLLQFFSVMFVVMIFVSMMLLLMVAGMVVVVVGIVLDVVMIFVRWWRHL